MKIIILGAGVAGVSSAIGLKKLGYEVIIINKKRPFEAIEGFSHHTIEGLKRANLTNAIEQIGEKVSRIVSWNGKTTKQNFEFIVDRNEFDLALLKDAKKHNIQVINSKAKILNLSDPIIQFENKTLNADFIVDARGRFAKKEIIKKSIPTKAMFIKSNTRNNTSKTSLHTNKYGWIFIANDKNTSYFQLTSDTKFSKDNFIKIFKQQNPTINNPKIITREASSYLSSNLISKNYIKIGDRACAVDPLSGNGVFQALSSALISPYIIHTLLQGKDEDKIAAKNFFQERIYDIFNRYIKISNEFYSLEKQHKSKFWITRANIKKDDNSLENSNFPHIAKKAILIKPFIKSHEVVVTKNHPLGVWKLGRIDLVEIAKKILNTNNKNQTLREICINLNLNQTEKNFLFKWLIDNALMDKI